MKVFKGETSEEYEIILKEEHLKYTFTKSGVTKSGTFHYRDFYFKKKRITSLFSSDRFHLDLIRKGQSTIHISFPEMNETQINEIFIYSTDRRKFFKKSDKETIRKRGQKSKKLRWEIERKKEVQKIQLVNKKIQSVIEEFDKDDNGIIDLIEDKNEFNLLLKKHQKVVIEKGKEFNQNFTHQFIKVGNYIKQKRINLQLIFDCTKKVKDKKDLDEYVDILEGEIHSYNLLLINSLNLIVSLIEDDQFTFYDIYEKFDKLNIYNSNWENEISQKLTTLNKGISELNSNIQGLMYEIRDMSDRIVSSIDDLSYITEESTRMLDNRLEEIDSSIKTNNLLTLINTYQTYKINKNTKSLRP